MEKRGVYPCLLVVCIFFTLAVVVKLDTARASTLEKWLMMPGPVVSSHADLEDDCSNCHEPLSDRQQAELCAACHTEVGRDIDEKTGLHGRLPASQQAECSSCHTDHEGRDMSIVELNEATFDHELTDFILRGGHVTAACTDCHNVGEAHRQAETACIGCHRLDDLHHGQLGETCDSCHNSTVWSDADFDHDTTNFLLTGAHVLATCSACHRNTDFSDVGGTCAACHQMDDVHKGRNGSQCAECHSTASWSMVTLDHLAISGFPLTGGHRGLGCQDCHRAGDFRDLGGSDCNACHRADDVHKGRNGPDCGSCHHVSNWSALKFDHATQTNFPLPSGHGELACSSCHTGGLHDALPRECAACHSDDGVHKGQLGTRCENCHVATDWTAQLWFDHDITSFPLLGAHADVSCNQCHTSAEFHDAGDTCVACHVDDDTHRGGLGNRCDSCHNPADWQAWQFNHDAQTKFALTGAHAGLACVICHSGSVKHRASTPGDCNSCHRRNDPHLGRFGNNCDSCHTTSSFSQIEGM